MGYLPKNSFMIFLDSNAPTELETISSQSTAEIESEHNEAMRQRLGPLIVLMRRAAERRSRKIVEEVNRIGPDESAVKEHILIRFPSTGEQAWRDFAWAAHEIVTSEHNEAKTERLESLIKERRQAEEKQLLEIVQRVQEIGTDESALMEYLSTTFPSAIEHEWNRYTQAVREIVTSKATLPDNRYAPWRTSESTVRFRPDGYLGVNVALTGTRYDAEKKERVADGSTQATLWVKVVEGWAKDGNWGGYLQISCRTEKGKYLDSRNGWVTPVASGQDKVTFYDMGNYYEIWQKDRESGRPLTVEGGCLRFTAGATPGKWNLQASTWD